ncbi:DUF6702 family protein [Aquirufa sp. 2-AUSEE-184A6]|uniref:DUF6702 family protein n=1 Tax=Aquirufa novilacunae TaxID=3139305 RepID=A0ABW8SX23_9BACT
MKLLVLFLSLFLPDLHPFHSSVTEMSYNQKDQSWEISIRLFQDDLEQSVSSAIAKKYRMIPGDEASEKELDTYLRKHFRFHAGKQISTPYRWLGTEQQQDAIWVYLEIPTTSDLAGSYLENSIFLEIFEDQTNLVQWASAGQKKSYLFRKSQEIQQLSR